MRTFVHLLVTIFVGFACHARAEADSTGPKISPSLLQSYSQKSTANIMITMREGPESIRAQVSTQEHSSRGAKITSLRDALVTHAERTQKSAVDLIKKARPTITIKSFWISNQIYVRDASLGLVQLLANNSAVSSIDEEFIIPLDPPSQPQFIPPPQSIENKNPDMATWGVVMVQAPRVWESPIFGANGTGVTVGIIDTGARYTHILVRGNYKSDGHSWLDPYDLSSTPIDLDEVGHGTHALGSIVGSHGYGVAPGAQWIACRGLGPDGGDQNALLACGEFMLCPTTTTGGNPDCSLAPRIVSNSWGGRGGRPFYNEVIEAWHAADIIPVFAIGNSGRDGCSSAGSPGDQPDIISVGATTVSDSLADFSSLGPSVEGRRTPEISAPGHNILSANTTTDTAIRYMSGTSMACPHVSGVIALLLSYKPFLKFNQIKAILETTADHDLTFNHAQTSCDGYRNDRFPNNHFGHGRINAYKAMVEAQDYNHGSRTHPCASIITLMLSATIVLLVQKTAF